MQNMPMNPLDFTSFFFFFFFFFWVISNNPWHVLKSKALCSLHDIILHILFGSKAEWVNCVLHRALLRPGRFDVEVRVFPPDLKGRKEIIEFYISKIKKDQGDFTFLQVSVVSNNDKNNDDDDDDNNNSNKSSISGISSDTNNALCIFCICSKLSQYTCSCGSRMTRGALMELSFVDICIFQAISVT